MELINHLFQKEWAVYAKRLSGHPKAVLEYPEMSLDNMEFIRGLTPHISPRGLVKIRHFGILSATANTVQQRFHAGLY